MTCACPVTSGVTSDRQVRPRSSVANTCGARSPDRCPSAVAKAARRSCGEASTQLIQVPVGRPGRFAATLVHRRPSSAVTCRLPSSVPTHTVFASRGDSLIVKTVQWFSAVVLSSVRPPDCSCFSLAGSFVVRSPDRRRQVSPRSVERCTYCEPTYRRRPSPAPVTIGVFQLKRRSGSPGPGCGRMSRLSPVRRSSRCTLPPCHSQ